MRQTSDRAAGTPGLRHSGAHAGRYLEWTTFSVLIPLLPVGAHLATGLFGSSERATFTSLFSDGELLVLATVIAAAAIGNLIFGLGRGELGLEGLGAASRGITFNLIVVVISVLLFGLVTLDGDSKRESLSEVRGRSIQTEAQAISYETQVAQLSDAARKQLAGAKGDKRAIDLATFLQFNADQLQKQATEDREVATKDLTAAAKEVTSGRTQSSYCSVVMFGVALLGGLLTIRILKQPHKRMEESALPSRLSSNSQAPAVVDLRDRPTEDDRSAKRPRTASSGPE